MRTKYGIYPEYHTSLDNLDIISPEGLFGSFEVISRSLEIIENNCIPKMLLPCEPQLGKYGLYPLISTKETKSIVKKMMDVIAYSDGKLTLLEISEIINVPFFECFEVIETLVEKGLMETSEISFKK